MGRDLSATKAILEFGADPNRLWQGARVVDYVVTAEWRTDEQVAFLAALTRAGASVLHLLCVAHKIPSLLCAMRDELVCLWAAAENDGGDTLCVGTADNTFNGASDDWVVVADGIQGAPASDNVVVAVVALDGNDENADSAVDNSTEAENDDVADDEFSDIGESDCNDAGDVVDESKDMSSFDLVVMAGRSRNVDGVRWCLATMPSVVETVDKDGFNVLQALVVQWHKLHFSVTTRAIMDVLVQAGLHISPAVSMVPASKSQLITAICASQDASRVARHEIVSGSDAVGSGPEAIDQMQ